MESKYWLRGLKTMRKLKTTLVCLVILAVLALISYIIDEKYDDNRPITAQDATATIFETS
jgi:hypothetical protein